jgi:hypothetical protein
MGQQVGVSAENTLESQIIPWIKIACHIKFTVNVSISKQSHSLQAMFLHNANVQHSRHKTKESKRN